MPHPDEGLIHAWLDGELSPEEAARVQRLVGEDPEWAAAAAEARGLVAASSRILGALDVVPGDVLPADSRSRFSVRPWMRVAAGLVIIVGTTVVVTNRVDVDSAFEPALVADRVTAPVQPPAAADPDGRVATDSVSRREAMRVADSTARREVMRVAAESRARNEATRAALAPTPGSAPAIADAVSPSQEKTSQSAAMDSAQPPAGSVTRLRSERGFGAVSAQSRPVAAGMTVSATVLNGCWRTITHASVDSVLVSPRIMETAGRMLTIAAGDLAITVVQQADTLRGTIIDADGTRVPFRAERIVCR